MDDAAGRQYPRTLSSQLMPERRSQLMQGSGIAIEHARGMHHSGPHPCNADYLLDAGRLRTPPIDSSRRTVCTCFRTRRTGDRRTAQRVCEIAHPALHAHGSWQSSSPNSWPACKCLRHVTQCCLQCMGALPSAKSTAGALPGSACFVRTPLTIRCFTTSHAAPRRSAGPCEPPRDLQRLGRSQRIMLPHPPPMPSCRRRNPTDTGTESARIIRRHTLSDNAMPHPARPGILRAPPEATTAEQARQTTCKPPRIAAAPAPWCCPSILRCPAGTRAPAALAWMCTPRGLPCMGAASDALATGLARRPGDQRGRTCPSVGSKRWCWNS